MMKEVSVILSALVLASCAGDGRKTPMDMYRAEGYRLVWSDEFNRDGKPDPANWIHETGFVRNEEAQWYQPENAWCKGGMLVIEGRREKIKNPNHVAGDADWRKGREYAEYTASSLKTQWIHSWKYGRFEMRARIPVESGSWPAFWTIGNAGAWPSCGEIDIMEYYRGFLLANLAWAGPPEKIEAWSTTRTPITELGNAEWAKQFHVWRMDWTKDSVKLYVDDRLLNETGLEKTINGSGKPESPFRQPHYILLNLAIGGTNGGDPQNTAFPQRYEVDYVRVYQRVEE